LSTAFSCSSKALALPNVVAAPAPTIPACRQAGVGTSITMRQGIRKAKLYRNSSLRQKKVKGER